MCADLGDFEPSGGPYDLVLLLFVHLPAPQRRRLLRLAATTLAPGGLALVVGYDPTHATEGQGGPRDPAIPFSPEDVVADLEGLRIERSERIVVGNAIDAVVRAVRD